MRINNDKNKMYRKNIKNLFKLIDFDSQGLKYKS